MSRNRDKHSDLSALFGAIQQTTYDPEVSDVEDWIGEITEENQSLAREEARKEKQKNDQRFRYAGIFVRLSTIWLVFIAFVIVAHDLDVVPFSLSDTILGILLGTTTLNVLGPYFWIARCLRAAMLSCLQIGYESKLTVV